jgi:hypothetical protein
MEKGKLFLLSFLLVFISAWSLPPAEENLELLDFTVIQNGNKVDIKWKTSIETGGPYFTIEKSKDGKEFTKVVDIPTFESGTVYSDYFETDYQPYIGVSYYRIKQTDEVGNFRYSQTVILKVDEQQNAKTYTAKSDKLNAMSEHKNNEILLVLRDVNGNDSYAKAEGNDINALNLTSSLSAGTYRVIGSSKDEVYKRKLILK